MQLFRQHSHAYQQGPLVVPVLANNLEQCYLPHSTPIGREVDGVDAITWLVTDDDCEYQCFTKATD
jgi:hypothetical protein